MKIQPVHLPTIAAAAVLTLAALLAYHLFIGRNR